MQGDEGGDGGVDGPQQPNTLIIAPIALINLPQRVSMVDFRYYEAYVAPAGLPDPQDSARLALHVLGTRE